MKYRADLCEKERLLILKESIKKIRRDVLFEYGTKSETFVFSYFRVSVVTLANHNENIKCDGWMM